MPGCRGGANVKAQAQAQPGTQIACARAQDPRAALDSAGSGSASAGSGSASARRLSVRSRPTMGSGPAAGTVRARYLVYFQYLGTDFKYVLRTSLRALDLPRATRRLGKHWSLTPRAAVAWHPRGGRELYLVFAPPASGSGTGEGMAELAA